MRVLVVGSLHFSGSTEVAAQFKDAARSIGAALARAGFEIIVGSDSHQTADRYIVEGAAGVEGRHRIRVIRPERGSPPFTQDAEMFGRIEFIIQRHRGPWAAGRVPQVLAADAVLVIGGGSGTESAGHIAAALQRPVVAVACFGGAARDLWTHLQPYYQRLGEFGEEMNVLLEHWQPSSSEMVVRSLRALVKSGVFRVRDRRPLLVLLATQVLLLTAWLWLFTHPAKTDVSNNFFPLLGVAAFLGTSLRTSLKLVFDLTADLSWDQVIVDLSAGLILAFGLSLAYLAGGIAVYGNPTDLLMPTTLPAFQRIAVVMTILGLTGGLMIEQTAEWLKKWLVDRVSGQTN